MTNFRGYSLVELLVAVALGMLISVAGVQLFVSSTATSSFQRSLNEVQSSGRYALGLLTDDIRTAGNPVAKLAGFPIVDTEVKGLPVGSSKINSNATQVDGLGGTNSDQLVVQYIAGQNATDCEGTAVASNLVIINRYFLRLDADSGGYALACDGGYIEGGGALKNYDPADTGLVLVTDVDSFQVLYGVDDGKNKLANIAGYVTAATYLAMAAPRPVILSVRIGLLTRTSATNALASPLPPANDIWVLNQMIAKGTTALKDGRLRRLFTTTLRVMNADPAEV